MELIRTLLDHAADERVEGLFAIERELRALLDRRLQPTGLTYSQCAMLRFIANPRGSAAYRANGEVYATDIARYYGFATRTVTVAVNGLVDAKLVRRRKSAVDGRAQCLLPTDRSQEVLRQIAREYREATRLFEKLPRSHWNGLWYTIPSILLQINAMNELDERREQAKAS